MAALPRIIEWCEATRYLLNLIWISSQFFHDRRVFDVDPFCSLAQRFLKSDNWPCLSPHVE